MENKRFGERFRIARVLLVLVMALVLVSVVSLVPASATNPTVTTVAASGVGDQVGTLNGNLAALGTGSTLVKVGFHFGTSATLVGNTNTTVGTKTTTGTFALAKAGLTPDVKYYFRAWARNFTGSVDRSDYAQGSILNFITTNTIGGSILVVQNVLLALIPLVVIVAIFSLITGLLVGNRGIFSKMNFGKK